jgi:TetR/AcrR family transcriptional regulator, transcriptional repressor for nem operon
MPWSKEHKSEVRGRIVRAASAAFRKRGIADVGVAEIMAGAGLTHGGFYGHFGSKDELLAAAVADAGLDTEGSLAELRGGGVLRDLVQESNAYLSPEHLAHPERGCPLAANGPELSRGSRKVRNAVGAEIHRRLARLTELDPARSAARRKRDAAGALACMIGGMVLARALAEPEARELLADVRQFVRDALA